LWPARASHDELHHLSAALEPADEADGMKQIAESPAHIKAQSPARMPPRASAEIVKLRGHIVSEFQSDAVELEEREPSRIAYLSLYLVTALIVAGITWACLSQVD